MDPETVDQSQNYAEDRILQFPQHSFLKMDDKFMDVMAGIMEGWPAEIWVKRQPKKGTSPRTSTQVIAKHETTLFGWSMTSTPIWWTTNRPTNVHQPIWYPMHVKKNLRPKESADLGNSSMVFNLKPPRSSRWFSNGHPETHQPPPPRLQRPVLDTAS